MGANKILQHLAKMLLSKIDLRFGPSIITSNSTLIVISSLKK